MRVKNLYIGNKAKNLLFLRENGFQVPDFRIITPEQVLEIATHPEMSEAIIHGVLGDFAPGLFAVRSSASTEDGVIHSNAGQYHTEIAVSLEGLHRAILETITISRAKLESNESLALILQAYIEPDISGVCFTRDPSGGREYVLEYHQGRGIDLVGGEIIPETIHGYWTDALSFDSIELDLAVFISIENLFDSPQDIEWCIRDGALYILQSRPITTIPDEVYRSILFLETQLSDIEGDYYYEKTGVTEVAPRPVSFTLSLLRYIYAQNGPIDKIYQRLGITYRVRDFLKVFGADLYVDREWELQTLLPAYSLLNREYKPKLASGKGLWMTLRNLYSLARGVDGKKYGEQILAKLTKNPPPKDLKEALDQFLRDYETIFLVNLSAAAALEKLRSLLGKEQSRLADILTLGSIGEGSLQDQPPQGSTHGLIGNSLDIGDETSFMTSLAGAREPSESAREWFASVPEWKRGLLQKSIDIAVFADQWREYGRILMVKNLSKIRTHLFELAEKNGFDNLRNIYFCSIDSCLAGDFSEANAIEQKKQFESDCIYTLPSSITRHYRIIDQVNLGVSAGKVTGILVDMGTIDSTSRPRILFTEHLSPDLYQHFGQIDGIISKHGGMLSHLSILARESGIPVVIASRGDLIIGERYEIDGGSGEIEKKRISQSETDSRFARMTRKE